MTLPGSKWEEGEMMKKNKNAWMESLEERIALTSSTIATGDMGGWVTRVNIVGRLGWHLEVGVRDELVQDKIVLAVFHRYYPLS